MKDPAVIDAYLGAHQDVDLGIVTGRIEGEMNTEAVELMHEIEEAEQADAGDGEEKTP